MKSLTKSFLTLLCMLTAGVTGAWADEEIALTADMFMTWNGYGADASSTGTATVDFNIGSSSTIGSGAMVCGTSTVDYLTYADLSGSSKMLFEGTPGMQLRVLMNRQESNNGPLTEKNPTIGEDGKAELDLSTMPYVHLNAIKTGWGSPSGMIASVKVVKPSDPLSIPKETLKKAISHAKMQTALGKTPESFGALQTAITAAQGALDATDATAESLAAATQQLDQAEKGLALIAGFEPLTAAMFQSHTAQGEAGTATGCSYVMFESTGLPYGDGSVGWLNYADLSAYDKLYVSAAAGTPRFCLNRTADGAQDNDDPATSQFIDIPGHAWGTEAYQTKEGDNVWVIDLKKLVAERGIAYLHSIKGANFANVTVTDMLLFKAQTPAIVAAYGTIWENGTTETVGDYQNIKLDAAYFEGLAKVGDIIRVTFTLADEARAPFRTIKDGQLALLDKNGEALVEVPSIESDDKPCNFVIDEDLLAKLNDEFVYVRYQNIDVTKIELLEGESTTEEVVTFDFNASTHAVSSNDSHDGDITVNEVLTENGVTMTITPSGGPNVNRYWGTANGPQMRMYGGTMTLVAPEGKAIVKVEYLNGKWEAANTINGEVAATGLWEGNSTNVVLAVAKNTQINKVVVTLADASDETTTYEPKSIANTAETAYTVAEAIALIDAGEALTDVVFVKGIVTKVDKFQDGAINYWISDDGTLESPQFECYKGKGIDGADFTSIDDVEVGAAVVVTGTLTKYQETYEFNAGNKLVSYEAPFKPAVADGAYYIYNVATKNYLAAGSSWGTHAVVNDRGLDYIVTLADGKYTLDSNVSNGGNNHFLNGEYNDGSAFGWTIEEVADGVFTIGNGTGFLTAADNGNVSVAADATAAAAQWQFVLVSDRLAALKEQMAAATAEAPVDVTLLVQAPDFNRNDLRNSVWVVSKDGGNQTIAGPNENRNTYGCESWNNTFDIYQTLTDVTDGIYEFTIAGYGTNGTTKIYANETEAPFVNTEAAANFRTALDNIANGEYAGNTTGKVNVIGGTLKIGVKRTEQVGQDWAVFDKAQLLYYGPISDPSAYVELYEQTLAAAEAAQNSEDYANVTGAEMDALEAAIAQYNNVDKTDVAALEEAINALSAALNAVKEAKAAYDALAAAKAAATVSTEAWPYAGEEKAAAVETAKGADAADAADATAKTAAVWQAYRAYIESNAKAEAVQNATDLTDKIVNPAAEEAIAEPWSVVLGEGSGGSLNILSGEPWTDSEGNTAHKYFDGGDWGASAWNVSMLQEIELPKGQYLLTAKGRASADVTLTLKAGEETKQMKAIGAAGGDFGFGWNDTWLIFNITDVNTITIGVQGVTSVQHNWMSFSEFRLVCLNGEPTGISQTQIEAGNAPATVYNLQGQRVTKARSGLYIVNGKKVLVK